MTSQQKGLLSRLLMMSLVSYLIGKGVLSFVVSLDVRLTSLYRPMPVLEARGAKNAERRKPL